MNILLTGASGFLGANIFKALIGHRVVVLGRSQKPEFDKFYYAEFSGKEIHAEALADVNFAVHAAALAHGKSSSITDVVDQYRAVNVDSTLNLARQCAEARVKRFIFISSIGVNGNINTQPFTEDDTPNPAELYAQSKWEAEEGLWEIQRETGMELVIIRPPLVYGPNAPGNFGSLMRWVEKGIPLPFGDIHNQRSLVALENLVDLIVTCIDHPAAANQVFLAGDGQDMSTTELLRGVAQAMGKPSRLIPVPSSLLMLAATLLGKKAVAQRLLGSLQVDISKARDLLGWEPPISVEEGLRRCFVENPECY